jgi:diguanylate cyclase (GGDEF)-like protein/PAS domain S-box-containing protein
MHAMNQPIKLYSKFFDLSNNALVIIHDKKIVDCNNKTIHLFNYKSKQELIGQFVLTLFPEYQPRGMSSVVRLHKIQNSIKNDCTKSLKFVCKKNNSIEFDAKISFTKHHMNNKSYLFVSIRCISEFIYDKKLLESEQFKKYIDVSSNYFVVLDECGKINFINNSLGSILANDKKYLIGKDWFDIALPLNSKEKAKNIFIQLMKGNIQDNKEVYNQPLLTKTGEERIVVWSNSVLKDKRGKIIGTLSSGHDLTDKLQIQRQLKETEMNFKQLVENINEVFWIKDIPNNKIIYISSAYEHIFNEKWNPKNSSNYFYNFVHPDDLANVTTCMKNILESGNVSKAEFRIIKPNGKISWIYSRAFPAKNKNNEIVRIIGLAEEITERKKSQNSLYKMATTDYLTGAYNRQHFIKTAEGFIAYSKLTHESISFLMFDIDYFKKINDTYGHCTGDEVLKEFVKLCTENLGDKDIFGRIGGEEFAILLTGYTKNEAYSFAENLRKRIEKHTLHINNNAVKFTISIGMTMLTNFNDDNDCVNTLLNNSDKALYQAKNFGRNKTIIYT